MQTILCAFTVLRMNESYPNWNTSKIEDNRFQNPNKNYSFLFRSLFAEGGCLKKPNSTKSLKQGLFFVPGLGLKTRIPIVLNNLNFFTHKFNSSTEHWDCFVYIYAPVHSEFWSAATELKKIASICKLVYSPLKKYGDHVKSLHPFLVSKSYKYVFLSLDDVELSENMFDINHIINIIERNNVTFASPFIHGAVPRKAMLHKAPNNAPGFVTHYIEIFAILMTTAAYTAFWELIDPTTNPCGWGPDMWYI